MSDIETLEKILLDIRDVHLPQLEKEIAEKDQRIKELEEREEHLENSVQKLCDLFEGCHIITRKERVEMIEIYNNAEITVRKALGGANE